MARDLIVALDEGTSNVKAVVIDARGQVVTKASRPLTVDTPQAGWVEQDGMTLLESSLTVIREVIQTVGEHRVAALAISNQRETVMGWERETGKPLAPAITWQCSRSAPFCDRLRADRQDETIRSITGLPVATLFSASKMRWLLDNTAEGVERPPEVRFVLALLMPGCCGTSPAASSSAATLPMLPVHNCSICKPGNGTRACWPCLACPGQRSRRSLPPAACLAPRAG